jgi:hypothetical protein
MSAVLAAIVVLLSLAIASIPIGRDCLLRSSKLGERPDAAGLAKIAESFVDITTSEFLLAEVRSQLERRTAAAQSIDTKISQFLSIVGGGAGLVALVSFKATGPPANPPALLIAAGISLLIVLTLCVAAAVPRRRAGSDLRAIESYNVLEFIGDPKNKAALMHELIARYANVSEGVLLSTQKKRWYYLAASALFVLALASVLGSFLYLGP